MLRKLVPQLPSLVVSIVALAIAGSGGALAATLTISGSQIAAGTITTHQLSPSVLKLLDEHKKGPTGAMGFTGVTGAVGATGATGAAGAAGVAGANGLDGVASSTAYESATIALATGTTGYESVACPAGTTVTGGGFFSNITTIAASFQDGNGWFVDFSNSTGITVTGLQAYVTCAT